MDFNNSQTKVELEGEKSTSSFPDPETARNFKNGLRPMLMDRKVRRKVDLHLIPLIAILYLCSFLYVHEYLFYNVAHHTMLLYFRRDRGNIGKYSLAVIRSRHLTLAVNQGMLEYAE
jgi:hypothetical protein